MRSQAPTIVLRPEQFDRLWASDGPTRALTSTSRRITIAQDQHPRANVAIEIVGAINNIELIATSRSLRESRRLSKQYGAGRWRKLKGTALVRLPDGVVVKAEVHWYEAHGIGKKEFKIKRILDE